MFHNRPQLPILFQLWAKQALALVMLLLALGSALPGQAEDDSPQPANKVAAEKENPAAAPAEKPSEEKAAEKKKIPKAESEKPAEETKPTESPAPAPIITNRDKIALDEEGRLQFNYVGQPWLQVLQDFADASGNSLDWQELPEGDLNLTTQRKYTLLEARDLLNRHLLARGFTMLASGEVLSVMKVDALDPSLIPRAAADTLEDYAPYDFMRVTFDLPMTIDPTKAVEDVKILLSPNAKATPLLASRRLLVIDAVTNLRDVYRLLHAERSKEQEKGQPREFSLKYRRAEYVAEQVLVVLGLDPNVIKTPDELKLETQRIQMQMKLIEKGKDVSKMIKKGGPKVHVAVNRRRNSILVNAPPELMAIVVRTVARLDMPDEKGDEREEAMSLKQYQLITANPNGIIRALEDIVRLDPRSRLQGDSKAKTLLATASKADHAKILQIIEKLDAAAPPSIEVDQLGEHPPQDFFRVRFQLPLSANVLAIAIQIRGLTTPLGMVQPINSSKQIIVTDTAASLINIRDVLKAESEALEVQNKVQEFPLAHRRATEMVGQVLTMLGLNPATMSPPKLRLELRNMNLFITANQQRNSLVVSANDDKIELVRRILEQLDVPEAGEVETVGDQQTLVPYKIVAGDMVAAIKVLKEIGNLQPRTRLQSDLRSKTLYAYANKADHQKIRQFVDEMNPQLVRRVEPDHLEDFPSHDTVRVRFQLPLSTQIGVVAKQIRGVLGLGARVQALASSKQLVVVDTVANLIEVRDLLYAERIAAKSLEMPMVFPLKHRRATYVADQVMILLGLDPSARKTSTEMQFEAQRMQMMMQQASTQGRDISKLGKPTVFIAVNRRQNSLLINAPPEKIPLIERTIEQIDRPVEEGSPIASGSLTMEKYQTITAAAGSVIGALEELGNLDPKTQLQGDATGKVIYAYASQTDHATIKRMISKLDGTGRKPEVRWLPSSLPADQVAGSIMALIVPPKKKEKNDTPWWYYRSNDKSKNKDERNDGFRILPDIEHNRLLLWATEAELEEVDNLIDKLSENLESAAGVPRKVRRLESRDPETIRKLLEQLQSTWPGKNPLEIQPLPAKKKPEAEENRVQEPEDKLTKANNSRQFWLAQVIEEGEQPTAPPIKIAVNEYGEILLASEDTEALDQLEELVEQISPIQTEFHTFSLRYIDVLDVVYNLEAYFAGELAEEKGESILDWFGRSRDTKAKPKPMTLGKRPPLRFIDDHRTNTLIVANANARQLHIIREQIAIYDRPPNPDLFYKRRTEAIKIKHSRAADIAGSLKEVFRDLLSSRDKTFRTKEGKQSGIVSRESSYIFGDARRTVKGSEGPVLVNFKGALSIGIDEISNSVIISAREEVLDTIKETITMLDQAAKPKTIIRIHAANGVLDAADLQQLIANALSNPWTGGKPGKSSAGKRTRKPTARRVGR